MIDISPTKTIVKLDLAKHLAWTRFSSRGAPPCEETEPEDSERRQTFLELTGRDLLQLISGWLIVMVNSGFHRL